MKTKLKLRDAEVIIEHDGKEVSNYDGDSQLVMICKSAFALPIEVQSGKVIKDKDTIADYTISEKLEVGDKGYIEAVIIERLQNEFGFVVES